MDKTWRGSKTGWTKLPRAWAFRTGRPPGAARRPKRVQGATTRNADRPAVRDADRSAAWDVAPWISCLSLPADSRWTLQGQVSSCFVRGNPTPRPKENPREPSTKARLPHRQKPHCEAPTGVDDPITT